MITKITNDKQTYFKQFEAINQALQRAQSPIRINSLEDYFSNIRTIASLTKIGSDVKGKFLIMPLDEPFFEIDANARAIKIPDNFKKYGIGVQNDHWAEILYFKIDRYYDYQDLASLNIFINWEFVPSGSRNGGDQEVKVSKAFAPDPDFEPNSLIFGWVVDRSMTPVKGVLKFSVTFTDSSVPGIAQGYQLSTLISQVNVNEGLVPQLNAELITINDSDFFARITNSAISSEGINGTLGAVEWKALPQKAAEGKMIKLIPSNDDQGIWVYSAGEKIEGSDQLIEKCYFPIISNDSDDYEEQEELLLAAEAVTADTVDSLNYLWATTFSTDVDLSNAHFRMISSDEGDEDVYFTFVKTNDTAFDPRTIYYKKNGTDLQSLVSSDAIEIFTERPEEIEELYERICLHVIDRGGYYTVHAQSTAIKDTNILTEDETVDPQKNYRKLVDGEYVELTSEELAGANPKENEWYEFGHKTCNSPIIYSNKFIQVPNAEIPTVQISTTDLYTPEVGDYEITDPDTPYNYIDIERTPANKPEIDINLILGENNEGIGGIAWQIGDPDVVNKVNNVEIPVIIQNSTDRSNSEFASVGAYKHIDAIDNIEYELFAQEKVDEEYHIRIFNQRNHTYSVTDDIVAMKLSYVAPKISAYNVIVVGGPVQGTLLLEAGETPNENGLMKDYSLNEASPTLTFRLEENFGESNSAINTLLSHYKNAENNLSDLSYKYFLEEVDYNPDREGDPEKRENDRGALAISTDTKGLNEVEIVNVNSVTIPESDTGYYRIRIETYYHNTKSVAYTDMFHVILG